MATKRIWLLLRTSMAAASAAAILGASPPAIAQQAQDRTQSQQQRTEASPQLSRAADEVFLALNRYQGREAYWDAMEEATDTLYRYGLISRNVERFYDRRESSADWDWDEQRIAINPRYHDHVMEVLRRNRGTPVYYQAMEAASDELEWEGMVSDATEEYFDRMAGRAGWGGYGYWRGGYPAYGGTYPYGPYGPAYPGYAAGG